MRNDKFRQFIHSHGYLSFQNIRITKTNEDGPQCTINGAFNEIARLCKEEFADKTIRLVGLLGHIGIKDFGVETVFESFDKGFRSVVIIIVPLDDGEKGSMLVNEGGVFTFIP